MDVIENYNKELKKKSKNYGSHINSFIQKMNDLIENQKIVDSDSDFNQERNSKIFHSVQMKQETLRKSEIKPSSKLMTRQKNEINVKN